MDGLFRKYRTESDSVPRSAASQHPEASSQHTDRPLSAIVGLFFFIAPAVLFAQPQVNSSFQGAGPATASSAPQQSPSQPFVSPPTQEEEIEALEEEVGDRDPTYLRTRLVFRYDHRLQDPISVNRFRLRVVYAFGPKQQFAVSFLEPVMHADTPLRAASGSGDAEAQFNANFIHREGFRMGAAVQSTLQTSSDALLGGGTTAIKPSWDLARVLSSRFELTAALYYKQSIHTSRGIPAKQFEPDLTLNARILKSTLFLEWDSYYDFRPERFAQTLKPGISRAFGTNRPWVASAYYAVGINDYAELSQYRYNAGFDLTWFPRKDR